MSPCKDCIAMVIQGNWNLKKWEGIEKTVEKIEKLRKEVEERINKNDMLKSKMTWDCYLSLQPIKRFESHLSYRGGFQE